MGARVRVVPRMWVARSTGLKRRLVPPLRGVCAAVRWYSEASTSDAGEPSTVKALHRQPDMLSRYEPRLIRNFRCAVASIDVGTAVSSTRKKSSIASVSA